MSPIQKPTTIAGWAIWLVITFAIVACVYVAANAFQMVIPWWIVTLFWICVGAAIIVAVITFLASLGGSSP